MLEIAGRLLNQRDISPGRLLDDLDDVTAMELPDGTTEAGHENMAKLIQQSLNALPDDRTRAIFMAFGHLPTTTATPELLALLLRDDVDDMNEQAYAERYSRKELTIHDLPDLPTIEKALDTLVTHGLAKRIPAETDGDYPYQVERFRLHDLAHSYATARTDNLDQMVTACVVYIWRHNTPIYDNFAALRSELENLMGASALAMTLERWRDAEWFAWNLYRGSEFTKYQGYYSDAVTLLTRASDAAGQRGDKQAQGGHLGNLGIAYYYLGQYQTAIEYFEQRIVIADEIGDREGKGKTFGNLGVAYDSLGQYQQAIDYCEQHIVIADEIGDKIGKGNALGNLGNVYNNLGDYDKAIDYYQQRVVIADEIGDKHGKGIALGNLGNAYSRLGDPDKAIDYYQEALDIAQQIGDRDGVSRHQYNLGLLYNNLERYAEALPLLEESLALVKAMGQLHYRKETESALARVRRGLAGED